jgi:hypothetical protein
MRDCLIRSTLLLAVLAVTGVAKAQTSQQPAAANAPATAPPADLSGVWLGKPANQWAFSKDAPPMQPDAKKHFDYNTVDWKNPSGPGRKQLDPTLVSCAPPGVPRLWLFDRPFEIIQRSNRVIIFYEVDHTFRQVWMDGREHPKDFGHTWTGHSTGNWDGDMLVIDTVGLNGEPWLDNSGHVYSNALHLTERIRRVDPNTLQIDITFDDPTAYTKTWTGQRTARLQPGRVIQESVVCGNRLAKEDP